MNRSTVIELYKEDMKFSAGHFTIFSKDHRERLHGHNFSLYAALTVRLPEDGGLGVDYGIYKNKLGELCKAWNEYFLLPGNSPHLQISETGTHVYARFGEEEIPFLKGDVLILPIVNVTLEELASLLLEKVIAVRDELDHTQVEGIVIKVFSGPGQNASAQWRVGQP
jgi:6-pyruvoyltetrahydropterin/6-carboxytetrahydropterin synthase